MFDSLIKRMRGYLYIKVTGRSCNRFINICAKNEINIWNVSINDEEAKFYVNKKDYEKMLTYAKKIDIEIHILKKVGLPYFFNKYKKRKIFFIGLLLFVITLYSFTFFIWDINVSGCYIYTSEQIMDDIVTNYVKPGSIAKKVDCSAIEKTLREKYDKVAWISCYVEGTSFNVILTETIEPKLINKNEMPCNIVAAKNGVITDIIVKSGCKVSSVGDEVKKGDILISGAVNIYNEYDELIETEYLPASGEIYAITEYKYSDEFPLDYYKKEYTGKEKKYFGLTLFNKTYIPYEPGYVKKTFDTVTVDYNAKLGKSYELPVGIKYTRVREYNPVSVRYSNAEAKNKAKKKLDIYLSDLRKKGVEILENNVTININDASCCASGTIMVKELIGVPSDITVFTEDDSIE